MECIILQVGVGECSEDIKNLARIDVLLALCFIGLFNPHTGKNMYFKCWIGGVI
jgi:hypothetical protein